MTHGVHTDQDLCVFVSNQVTFANKSCAQQSGAFNSVYTNGRLVRLSYGLSQLGCNQLISV